MLRKYWSSFIDAMGLLAIAFSIFSLIAPDVIQIRFLHFSLCIVIPNHLFAFLTFELKLFSSRLWIRRIIVIFFEILVMFVVECAFGYLRWKPFKYSVAFGASILIFILLTVFAYYVCDKIEQHNLKLINQKLGGENAENIE